jgi:uncharacterized protein DUF4177
MPSVVCPTCGEKGRIPSHFIGIRIKCKMCGNSFLVTPPVSAKASAPAEAAATPAAQPVGNPGDIAVEGLDASAWSAAEAAPAVATAEHHEHEPEHEHDEAASAFTATPSTDGTARKVYKLLTPRDPWFEGKFDIGRMEEALNHYARQGWIARSMATPHVTTFSGGTREELVILLER